MNRHRDELVRRYPFGPVLVFGLGGTLAFACIYTFTTPPGPLIAALVGVVLLCLFVAFLAFCRTGHRGAIGTAAPAIIGPALASLYVTHRAPHLLPVLHGGGDLLIQLAFFFATLFGAAAYMFVMFGEKEVHHKTRKMQVVFVLFVVVILVLVFCDITSQAFRPGPPIAFGISAPDLSWLTVARVGLALLSIVLASWPSPAADAGSTDTDATK